MYLRSDNFSEEPYQEIVCLVTGERYVHFDDDENSIIDPKLLEGSVEYLPSRFYKQPFIVKQPNGHMRVFGSLD